MSTNGPTIPADVAAHVLWHYGRPGGYQPGSFTETILTAIGMADPSNLDRLAAGFPEYVAAVAAIQYDPQGIERLQSIVRGGTAAEEPPAPQCPEALFNPETGNLRRCVQGGWHDWHQTSAGTQWRIPVDGDVEVPF